MNPVHLALGILFAALAAAMFASARRATDGRAERNARLAGTLFSVASVAFLVAAALSWITGLGG